MKHVYSIGEVLVDFLDKGDNRFIAQPGGAPANVSACISRLGGKTSFIGSIGDDFFGKMLKNTLDEVGVDTTYLETINRNTMLAFVKIKQQGDREFSFYRENTADSYLPLKNVAALKIDQDIMHFCSVCLNNEHNRFVHKTLIDQIKMTGGIVSFDPNLRFNLWQDIENLRVVVDTFIKDANIVKLSEEELLFITNTSDENLALKKILHAHQIILFVTRGENGSSVYVNGDSRHYKLSPDVVIDTTGAGDAFIGAVLYKIQKDSRHISEFTIDDWEEINKFACLIAQSTTKFHGAITSYIFDEFNQKT